VIAVVDVLGGCAPPPQRGGALPVHLGLAHRLALLLHQAMYFIE
jgi:hypothetical protein